MPHIDRQTVERVCQQVYNIAYKRHREPDFAENRAYATALRSLYARHGKALSPAAEGHLHDHERMGGFVRATTADALDAGITQLEIIAVARIAYPKGKS